MDQVGSLLARPWLYRNVDGLVELGAGVMCLGYSFFLLTLMRTPAHTVWHRISSFGFVALIFFIHYGTKAVKARITYPRTGFVEYRKQWRASAISAALGAMVVFSLPIGFRRHWDIVMLAPLAGLAFAASYGYHIATAVRWKWVIAGVIAGAPLAVVLLPTEILRALGSEVPAHPNRAELLGTILLLLMAWGAILLISGGISLWLYLRHTQAPAQEG
jgi:hypothetical protein